MQATPSWGWPTRAMQQFCRRKALSSISNHKALIQTLRDIFMQRRVFIFIIAFLGIISAFWAAKKWMTPPAQTAPIAIPPMKPYPNTIAASGLIEALGDNIAIGSPVDGIIEEVYVKVWQEIKRGDPLFKLESCELECEIKIAKAKEKVAKAEYDRIHDQLSRLLSVKNSRAISQEELRSKENESYIALAILDQVIREKEKVIALLDRLTVRSPTDGVVLQKNIRVGEYLVSANFDRPPLVLGDISRLQIKADIDEHNASCVGDCIEAFAYPKNRPNYMIPLTLVHIEPHVVPKLSLTGSSREKVDTRVLRVIYVFDPPQDISLFVGQQVDIFIRQDVEKS